MDFYTPAYYIVAYSGYLVISLVLVLLLKEIAAFFTLKVSIQQGVVNLYHPMLGFTYYYGRVDLPGPRNFRMCDLLNKHKYLTSVSFKKGIQVHNS